MNILMITDNDPAGMGIAFTNAINRYSEHTCRLITTAEKYGFNYERDIHLPEIEDDDYGEIEQLLKEADIIHFHVLKDENCHLGPLVIRDYIKGKKILHHHHGHPDYILNAKAYNEKYRKLKRKVIVSTPDLLKVADNASWLPNLVPIHDALFLPKYDDTLPQNVIRVCQAPTRKYHKDTRDFRFVVTMLQSQYPQIELLIIEKTPHTVCLRLKRNSHIVFDHMRGWFGIASLESLSQGKPVIAGIDDWNTKHILNFSGTESLPWLIARVPEDLKTTLTALVFDKELRERKGREARFFMENFWNEKKVLHALFQIYGTL